jgi:hypothetical protein
MKFLGPATFNGLAIFNLTTVFLRISHLLSYRTRLVFKLFQEATAVSHSTWSISTATASVTNRRDLADCISAVLRNRFEGSSVFSEHRVLTRQAAASKERLSGDVRSIVGCQKREHGCNFFRRAGAPHGNVALDHCVLRREI